MIPKTTVVLKNKLLFYHVSTSFSHIYILTQSLCIQKNKIKNKNKIFQ